MIHATRKYNDNDLRIVFVTQIKCRIQIMQELTTNFVKFIQYTAHRNCQKD